MVDKEWKGTTGFCYPILSECRWPKGDDRHAGVAYFNFCFVLEQLHHMFPAGQSTQVAQEDQQGIAALVPCIRKFNRVIR